MRVSTIDMIADDRSLRLSLKSSTVNDKYLVKAIYGLDADEIVPRFYGFAAVSGKPFYSYSLPRRDIVIRAVLNPNYTINESYADIRDELYRVISASRTGEVKMIFGYGGGQVAQIEGRIVKFEVPHFSKVPELQVTLECIDPLLRGVTPVELDSTDLTVVGDANAIRMVDAFSTAPHGFTLESTVNVASIGYWNIECPNGDWFFHVTYPFLQNDVIKASSEYGRMSLSVTRSSVETFIMDTIESGSMWPVMFPGTTQWVWQDGASYTNKKLTFTAAYWGV